MYDHLNLREGMLAQAKKNLVTEFDGAIEMPLEQITGRFCL